MWQHTHSNTHTHTHTNYKLQYTHTHSDFLSASVENILAVRHQCHRAEIIFTARQQHAFLYVHVHDVPHLNIYESKGYYQVVNCIQKTEEFS